MAVTRSRAAERAQASAAGSRRNLAALRLAAPRSPRGCWPASLLLLLGFFLVYRAKTRSFAEIEAGLASKQLLNLNDLSAREDLLPYLAHLHRTRRAPIRGAPHLRRLGQPAQRGRHRPPARLRSGSRGGARPESRSADAAPCCTGEQFRQLKPLVRGAPPGAVPPRVSHLDRRSFFAAFWAAHLWWSVRAIPRRPACCCPPSCCSPALGLNLMVSLRDPVRDSLLFVDFAQGVAAGCVLLAVASALDYERLLGKLSFVPLLASFALSALLIVFGYGPGTSDAKVNLFGFQPVEIIRILLILFLAGYFAQRWDVLRHAREQRPRLALFNRLGGIPPLEYTLPIFACVALSLLFFFLQKDMGPAMVFTCLFLALYSIARKDALIAAAGLPVSAGRIRGRISGARPAHCLRARLHVGVALEQRDPRRRSTGAIAVGLRHRRRLGHGPGLGDPALVPAAHTDLILSALGEEWGFLGVAAVFALYAFILYRAARIALRARSDYEFFLAAGLGRGHGAADPADRRRIAGRAAAFRRGHAVPELWPHRPCWRIFSMFAMLLSISSRPGGRSAAQRAVPRARRSRRPGAGCAGADHRRPKPPTCRCCAAPPSWAKARWWCRPMARAAISTIRASRKSCATFPRAASTTATACRWPPAIGTNWRSTAPQYQQLGIDIDRACSRTESRHYPFGGLTFDLLGDLRTRIRWGAGNTSFVERDSATPPARL